MDLSLVIICFLDRSWNEALDAAASYGFRYVEPCSGGYMPKTHYDPVELVASPKKLRAFQDALTSREIRVSALQCAGNSLHPDPARSEALHADLVSTCELASRIGVDKVVVLSGCPAGNASDRTVNWIVRSVFDEPDGEVDAAYEWQWQERVIPYWREAASIAYACGVKLCVEPIASNCVYNGETFTRLREAVGPTIGMALDPSHLFWQGIDIPLLIHELGDAVYSVHVKDSSLIQDAIRRNGVVSARRYEDWDERPWVSRAIGYGHSETFWREFVVALRRVGFEGQLALEVEEQYLTTHDALTQSLALMRSIVPAEGPRTGNWFEIYQ
jgi:sugar phosphate isomerase/epimerase